MNSNNPQYKRIEWNDIVLNCPANYRLDKQNGINSPESITLTPPFENNTRIFIEVVNEKYDNFMSRLNKDIDENRNIPDLEISKEKDEDLIVGGKQIKSVLTRENWNRRGLPIKKVNYVFFTLENKIIYIEYIAREDNFNQWINDLELIIESIQIIK